ncbi:hypothetical protein [Pseudomonas synxantha]|uniref:Uncharacterized protein n=1 Tax=Pseudomonas synxantha TaxID=47883 RepID=A0ACC6JP82_9PSED|nr:hypothetical protein [Pseudomonas synxantha]MDR6608072.1 hypothetical protein [Pseudomonas synxantha]
MTEQFTRWDSAEYLKTEEDMGQLGNFSRDTLCSSSLAGSAAATDRITA